jgi:hypothetical protein
MDLFEIPLKTRPPCGRMVSFFYAATVAQAAYCRYARRSMAEGAADAVLTTKKSPCG